MRSWNSMVQLCSVTIKWCHQLSWEFYSQLRVIVCDMFSCSLRCRMVGEGPLHGHAAATATATRHERAGNGAPPAVPSRGKEFEFGGGSSSSSSFPGYCRHSVHGSIPELYGSGGSDDLRLPALTLEDMRSSSTCARMPHVFPYGYCNVRALCNSGSAAISQMHRTATKCGKRESLSACGY